jgi:calcium/calmodulin-dependent protein kinase I
MSKWLKRGFGQSNSNFQDSSQPLEQTEFTPPMPVVVDPQPQSSNPMVGYGTNPPPATVAMDVDHHRNKYGPPPSYSSKPYDLNTRSNARTEDSRSSRRPATREHRTSSRSMQQAPSGYSQSYQRQPNVPPNPFAPPQQPSHHPMTSEMQPAFPPPAVTSDSETMGQAPIESSQRRPAYLLHRDLVIGKGSYGQVCIASRGESEGHTTTGRSGKRKKFACKCVMLRNDPKYIAKLQEEVNVLRELRGHANVIRLYDVFCVDNELFIITELGRGGDLFHLLTTHPKHGVTEAYAGTFILYDTLLQVTIVHGIVEQYSNAPFIYTLFLSITAKTVAEMLSAVAFLHLRSICHRDLKLENWVLESGKDVWSPLKLIDFGLSTHFTPGQRLSRVVGSSYYVAPEVLKKSYTEACDLWSLGVIVYMLLSGAPPFYGKNDEAIKASIVQGEYTFPHELFRDVSDEAMGFVSTLLSYNIEYRNTAEQALTHPWLATNCDPETLQKAKDGARGIGIQNELSRLDPMQM